MKINEYGRMLITAEVVLAIIMVIFIVFSLFDSYGATIAELQKDAQLLSSRHDSFLQQILYSSRAFADKERSDMKYSDYYRNDDITSKLLMIEDIRNFRSMSNLFDFVYYIDGRDMSVWGADGRYELEYFDDVFFGMNKAGLQSFLMSDSTVILFTATIYNMPATAIMVKGTKNSTACFVYLIERNHMYRYLGPIDLIDVLDEEISYGENVFFSSVDERKLEMKKLCSIKLNEFEYHFNVNQNWALMTTFRNSAIFILVAVLSWVIFSILVFLLVRKWYAPIDRVLTHIGKPEEMEDGSRAIDTIIDTYDELKAKSLEYETDVVLFRLLFSGDCDVEELKEYGIYLEESYYFFCLYSSEEDYMISATSLEQLVDTDTYRIYISEHNIVTLVVSKLDLVTLEEFVDKFKYDYANVTVSTISDDARYLRYCYFNAEQDCIATRMTGGVTYPYDEIRELSVSLGMDNEERALILLNQLILIASKAESKLKNDILYDMAKILVRTDERAHLSSIRYNKSQLEALLLSCRDRLIADCDRREKRADRKHKMERNIDSIEAYIKEHCMEKDYSLKSLAFEFSMSYSNLCHYYKDNTGTTITVFTDCYKIARAKTLMMKGMKIYDVAARLGYNSPQTFSRVFKKYEGILPKAYMLENSEIDKVNPEEDENGESDTQ